MKTKTNIDLGDCLATSSQPAVHPDPFTVDEGDVADHEPFACGDHAQIESGNLNQYQYQLFLANTKQSLPLT